MIRNYFIIAWRNLKNNLLFSSLNIIGLSIGMAGCLLTALFAIDQYSYDAYHEKGKRIYRVVNRQVEGSKSSYVAITQGVLGPELQRTFPEIEAATRVGLTTASLILDDHEPLQEKIMAVDPSFFSMFTIPFVKRPAGDSISVDGILISEKAALRLFGDANPVGEAISLGKEIHLTVTGVFKDFPTQSHLHSQFIVSFYWLEQTNPHARSWSSNSYYNYVLMPEKFDREGFNRNMNAFIHNYTPASWKSFEYFLQPLSRINLESNYQANAQGSVGTTLILGFVAVGLIILLLACFNYMNMATARSARRALEVGIRKVVGADRSQLVRQFLTESLILCVLGFSLAILWADFGIQFFSSLTNFKLSLKTFFGNPTMLFWLLVCLMVVTVVAGGYPAFFLSRYLPAAVLKGQRISDASRRLRKGLVVFQFTLTSLLVALVIVVFKQMTFMQSQDLGFNKEALLLFGVERNSNISLESFKAELINVPGVEKVCTASGFPGYSRVNTTTIWENGKPEEESIKVNWLFTDHDYIPTLELNMLAGRNFLSNGTDEANGAIINESAARAFGWTAEEAIGKRLTGFTFSDSIPGEVLGVIQDFHVSPLRREILPLIIGYSADRSYYMVRLSGSNVFTTREMLEKVGARLTADDSFETRFMEEAIEESYRDERRVGEILSFFSLLAVLLGCSGLYALSAYEGEQRIKELGIRKIMGASLKQLLFLLSKDFLSPLFISLIIAMPLAYYVGSFWLSSYPYRISWSADIFILSSAIVIVLGWLTVFGQAFKASRLNPVDTLRYE